MSSVIAETIDIILEKSPAPLGKISIDDLVIGIFFTGVKLLGGHAGVAFVMAGVRISNPDLMIKILKQGGSGYHILKECSWKIAFVRR